MYFTKEMLRLEVEEDLANDIIDGIQGTLRKLLGKQFTEWARAYTRFDELADDAVSFALMELQKTKDSPECFELSVEKLVNTACAESLKMHRSWLKLKNHAMREYPWDPVIADDDRPSTRKGFEVFDAERFVAGIEATNHGAPLPKLVVNLDLLTEEEMDMLSMLGAGLSQKEVALALGWDPSYMRTDHRGFVQNRLRSIRRRLFGGRGTQAEAVEWLRSLS